jgi:hypothetical protein
LACLQMEDVQAGVIRLTAVARGVAFLPFAHSQSANSVQLGLHMSFNCAGPDSEIFFHLPLGNLPPISMDLWSRPSDTDLVGCHKRRQIQPILFVKRQEELIGTYVSEPEVTKYVWLYACVKTPLAKLGQSEAAKTKSILACSKSIVCMYPCPGWWASGWRCLVPPGSALLSSWASVPSVTPSRWDDSRSAGASVRVSLSIAQPVQQEPSPVLRLRSLKPSLNPAASPKLRTSNLDPLYKTTLP